MPGFLVGTFQLPLRALAHTRGEVSPWKGRELEPLSVRSPRDKGQCLTQAKHPKNLCENPRTMTEAAGSTREAPSWPHAQEQSRADAHPLAPELGLGQAAHTHRK